MMSPLIMGTLSFLLMAASDYCFLHKRGAQGNALFLSGSTILIASTLYLIWDSDWKGIGLISLLPIGLALVSAAALVYSVFFAVKPTAQNRAACPADKQPLVCNGMYALCRHPGVLWLGAFYAFSALALSSRKWLLACVLFTLGDTLYVFYQDRCIFPHMIDRYSEYQKNTPFLIPTASSVKEAMASFKQSERNNGHDIRGKTQK